MRETPRESGSILFLTLVLVAAAAAVGALYYNQSILRDRTVESHEEDLRTFVLAETAFHEAFYDLSRQGDGNLGTDLWDPDVDDVGADGAAGTGDFGEGDGLPTEGEPNLSPVSMGNGIYFTRTVDWSSDGLDNNLDGSVDDAGENGYNTVHAFARVGNNRVRHLSAVVQVLEFNVWDNAVYAGDNGASHSIRGNARIHGSVHIVGDNLTPSDYALDMSGTAGVFNNYSGMSSTIASKIPSLSGDLKTVVRVKSGKVGLSGTGTVGSFTEPVKGTYVTDGWGGTAGESSVHSDNGANEPYDIPENLMTFPSLYEPYTDPDTGTEYSTYKAYYEANSLTINASSVPSWTGGLDPSTGQISVSDGANSFSYNPLTKKMTVNGMVTIDGNLTIGGAGPLKLDLTYEGNGSLFLRKDPAGTRGEGTLDVKGDVLPNGTFPTADVVGFMAEKDITLTSSAQLKLIGAFFAEGKISSAKQNEIAGTLVANEIDMGTNVPKVYQVPALKDYLPPGLIGSENREVRVKISWREE